MISWGREGAEVRVGKSVVHFILIYSQLLDLLILTSKIMRKKLIRGQAHDSVLHTGRIFTWDIICDSISFARSPHILSAPIMFQALETLKWAAAIPIFKELAI